LKNNTKCEYGCSLGCDYRVCTARRLA